MYFNYLNDASPQAIERLRGLRIAAELKTPLAALLTACVVVCAWMVLERYWIDAATQEEARAMNRLASSRAAFAATKLVRLNVDQLLALDTRLRNIRLSGSVLSEQLADIGNHIPSQAWLTSISHATDRLQIEGRAEGLNVLGQTVADLMSSKTGGSPTLIRAVKQDPAKGGTISFAMELKESIR